MEKFLQELAEENPKIFLKNKRFWKDFPRTFHKFVDANRVNMIEEIDPGRVDICPKCKTMVIPHDKYCSNCGVPFDWNS